LSSTQIEIEKDDGRVILENKGGGGKIVQY